MLYIHSDETTPINSILEIRSEYTTIQAFRALSAITHEYL
jgi:hypothetical protein